MTRQCPAEPGEIGELTMARLGVTLVIAAVNPTPTSRRVSYLQTARRDVPDRRFEKTALPIVFLGGNIHGQGSPWICGRQRRTPGRRKSTTPQARRRSRSNSAPASG